MPRFTWRRMPMEAESPEEFGYDRIRANLAESSLRDRPLSDLGLTLDDTVLLYGDHRGLPELRAALADGLHPDDVLVTGGAAMALFLLAITIFADGGHLVVVKPNYATNLETPLALGVDTTRIQLRFEDGYRLDVDRIAAALRPDTRLISVTTPHNPAGVELDEATLTALVDLAERHGCHLLVDETYRDMAGVDLPVAATRSPRVISVSSVSKTYGVPGLRVGWILARDPALQARLLMAKEQVVLTGSVLDERAALRVLEKRPAWLPEIRALLDRRRAQVATVIAAEPGLDWVAPTGGCVAFPRLAAGIDPLRFYALLHEAGVHVGPGHWFEEDPRSFRLGFGWPTDAELEWGLRTLRAAIAHARA